MSQRFKMIIANVYSLGEGVTVTGRIEQGAVRVGDSLIVVCASGRIPVRVVLLQKFREVVTAANAGVDPIGISLSGIESDQIHNRDLLVTTDS